MKKFFTSFALLLSIAPALASPSDESFTEGNRIVPLRNGEALNQKRLELVNEARRFIYVKTFIINRDQTEKPVYDALCRRAKEGLDVRMLVDDFGRHDGGNPIKFENDEFSIEWFQSCGIRFERFGTPDWAPLAFLRFSQHDKLFITENGGIMGGTNFSRDYSQHGQTSKRWYDFDIFLQGPAVCQLQAVFNESWTQAYQKTLEAELQKQRSATWTQPQLKGAREKVNERFLPETLAKQCDGNYSLGPSEVKILYNSPYFSGRRPFRDYLLRSTQEVIDSKQNRQINLYSPYCVMSAPVRDKLIEAAQSGVRVRVITNSKTSIDPEAFQSYVRMLMTVKKLLAAGVEIYLWNPANVAGAPLAKNNVFHKKGGCFGEFSCFVGSHNLDIRGDEYSSELMAVVHDRNFQLDQQSAYEDDLFLTTRLTEKDRAQFLKDSKLIDQAKAIIAGWAM